ncbi:hypothetical protein B0H19DRAFT_929649 [Mycena capillaripes]|nr:hypothetical protein B0H19DRAFT_929649 [Mycena capillaripes]
MNVRRYRSQNVREPDFLTQIPQPIHRNSEMKAILSVDLTSMQSFPGETI